MNALHWIARHWFLAWVLAAAAFVIGWAIFLAWFGESDEQRDARRRREAHDRTMARYAEIAELYKARERKRHEAEMTKAVDATIATIVNDPIEANNRDVEEARGRRGSRAEYSNPLERMRETEGNEDAA